MIKSLLVEKTKNETIAVNVIASFVNKNVQTELEAVNFIAIIINARSDLKLVPVLARSFVLTGGVKIRLLEFDDVSGETLEILLQHVSKTLQILDL